MSLGEGLKNWVILPSPKPGTSPGCTSMGGRLLQMLSHLCSWAPCSHICTAPGPWRDHFRRWVSALETPFQVNRSWRVRCLNNLSWSSLASPLDSCEPGSSGWGRGDWKPLFAAPACWMHPPRPGGNTWRSLSSPFSLASSLVILSSDCPLESPGKLKKKKFLYPVPTLNRLELASNAN